MIEILKEYTDTIQLYSDNKDKQIQYLNELSEFCKLQKSQISGKLSPENLLVEVCNINNVDIEFIKSPLQNGKFVLVRHEFFYLMKRFYIDIPKKLSSLSKTGQMVNRHHATVLWGYNRIKDFREYDKLYNSQFIDKYSHLFVY